MYHQIPVNKSTAHCTRTDSDIIACQRCPPMFHSVSVFRSVGFFFQQLIWCVCRLRPIFCDGCLNCRPYACTNWTDWGILYVSQMATVEDSVGKKMRLLTADIFISRPWGSRNNSSWAYFVLKFLFIPALFLSSFINYVLTHVIKVSWFFDLFFRISFKAQRIHSISHEWQCYKWFLFRLF